MNTISLLVANEAIARLMDGKLEASVTPEGVFAMPFDEVRITADGAIDLRKVHITLCRGGVDMVDLFSPAMLLTAGSTLTVSGITGTIDARLS